MESSRAILVAPLAGAWIEIVTDLRNDTEAQSLPLRERGLKLDELGGCKIRNSVAPLAGAWIEIYSLLRWSFPTFRVAPLAGAWIEIV